MLEGVTTANTLPVDDVVGAPFVLRMALDTSLPSKGPVEPAFVLNGTVTRQAFLIRYAFSGFVTLRATVGDVICRVSLIQRSGRHAEEALSESNAYHEKPSRYERRKLEPTSIVGTDLLHGADFSSTFSCSVFSFATAESRGHDR